MEPTRNETCNYCGKADMKMRGRYMDRPKYKPSYCSVTCRVDYRKTVRILDGLGVAYMHPLSRYYKAGLSQLERRPNPVGYELRERVQYLRETGFSLKEISRIVGQRAERVESILEGII